jgi:hypothetical protein
MTNRFIDKAHAEGVVWCHEAHLKRITRLLDAAGVPIRHEEKSLTVEQRVWVLKEAFQESSEGRLSIFNRFQAALEDLPPDTSGEDGPDPEALNAALSDDGIEWPSTTEQVNAIFEALVKR